MTVHQFYNDTFSS